MEWLRGKGKKATKSRIDLERSGPLIRLRLDTAIDTVSREAGARVARWEAIGDLTWDWVVGENSEQVNSFILP